MLFVLVVLVVELGDADVLSLQIIGLIGIVRERNVHLLLRFVRGG